MSYSLNDLMDFYSSYLQHTDEKIIILFHYCMLIKDFIVINGKVKNSYLKQAYFYF
jgi:hypothetical protein